MDQQHAIAVILKCANLFHSNNYPIFIIESKNGGGSISLSHIFNQVLQVRIANRNYEAYKDSNFIRNYRQNDLVLDLKNCKYDNPFNLGMVTDYYSNDGSAKIEHKRTSMFDMLDEIYRNALKNYREQNINNNNLKRPTDIIIFTDSYSFSATSSFINNFQNTGGAIIVGYYGNPKIEGIDFFDSSQSNSEVINDATSEFPDLVNLGFGVIGITIGEFYQDLANKIPMEYAIHPVDDRVNIYSEYSDDIYDKFIEEGKNVHK